MANFVALSSLPADLRPVAEHVRGLAKGDAPWGGSVCADAAELGFTWAAVRNACSVDLYWDRCDGRTFMTVIELSDDHAYWLKHGAH